jgi:hypothetical protein
VRLATSSATLPLCWPESGQDAIQALDQPEGLLSANREMEPEGVTSFGVRFRSWTDHSRYDSSGVSEFCDCLLACLVLLICDYA